MRMHPERKKRNIIFIVIAIIIVFLGSGFLIWRTMQPDRTEQSYVPQSLSSELFFSPYIPTQLPDGYKIDIGSYSVEDQALLFSAVNNDRRRTIVFSEQAMPKDFDINEFHKTNLTDAARIDGLKYPVIFGQITGQNGKIASVSTEGTWTLITMPQTMTQDDASKIVSGLVRQ